MAKKDLVAQRLMDDLVKEHGSVTKAAEHLGINKGIVSMVRNHARRIPAARKALGLIRERHRITVEMRSKDEFDMIAAHMFEYGDRREWLLEAYALMVDLYGTPGEHNWILRVDKQ